MAEDSFLTDDFLRQLINVGEVDILVGLPTHNNAKTVGSVVRAIQSGILNGFPRERAVIINVDGGSRDGTPDLVTGVSIDDMRPASNLYALRTLHSITTKYGNSPASGVAFRTILVVNNLSNSAQAVELDLRRYKGNIPIEMFGRNMFPRVGDVPYLLTMGPYQFYWFRLRRI